jgi:hypothetical protein
LPPLPALASPSRALPGRRNAARQSCSSSTPTAPLPIQGSIRRSASPTPIR